jgi:hypothetical protein
MTPSRSKYAKIPPQASGSSYFLTEKSSETAFKKKTFTRHNPKTFSEE